jgi:hypothetical protein
MTDEHHTLACYKQGNETIEVIHHQHGFTVRILNGKWHGSETHCRTEQSALELFDSIVTAIRK